MGSSSSVTDATRGKAMRPSAHTLQPDGAPCGSPLRLPLLRLSAGGGRRASSPPPVWPQAACLPLQWCAACDDGWRTAPDRGKVSPCPQSNWKSRTSAS
eukprot:5714897-Prymnesium_polylepis.1